MRPNLEPPKPYPFAYYAAAILTCLLMLSAVVIAIRQAIDTDIAHGMVSNESRILHEQALGSLTGFTDTLQLTARNAALAEHLPAITTQLVFAVEEVTNLEQVGILDGTGTEIVRVHKDGERVAVAQELQDKSERYYVSESQSMDPGTVYISRLNLNSEHGQIETPWRPTLRLVTHIPPSPQGRGSYLVVLNIDASLITHHFKTSTDTGVERYLLNSEGYWLAGKPADELWGFMFHRPPTGPKEYPALWQLMTQTGQKEGVHITHNSVVAFKQLDPAFSTNPAHPFKRTTVSAEKWWIVCKKPVASPLNPNTDSVLLLFGIIAIGLVVSWKWSRSAQARYLAERQAALAQHELVRSERLAALGGLVAGVAHELNTPLGNAVTAASSLSAMSSAIATEMHSGKLRKSAITNFVESSTEGTGIVLKNLRRAAELIGRFKAVAVDQASEQRRTFKLTPYLNELAATLQPSFKHTPITLQVLDGPSVELDSYPGALGQVVINLVNNARVHAFSDCAAGTVHITTGIDKSGQATITVNDDGTGIPPHVVPRIFEPFFTTRLGQGGSGLGLSITQNIVQNVLGGDISVATEPGKFTAFTIEIPRVAPQLDKHTKDPHHVVNAAA